MYFDLLFSNDKEHISIISPVFVAHYSNAQHAAQHAFILMHQDNPLALSCEEFSALWTDMTSNEKHVHHNHIDLLLTHLAPDANFELPNMQSFYDNLRALVEGMKNERT